MSTNAAICVVIITGLTAAVVSEIADQWEKVEKAKIESAERLEILKMGGSKP